MRAITFGNASQDDHGNSHAYCGCVGIYSDKEQALNALLAEKESCVADLKSNYSEEAEDADELQSLINSIQVYGSVQEEYFEIDFDLADSRAEYYLRLEEVHEK